MNMDTTSNKESYSLGNDTWSEMGEPVERESNGPTSNPRLSLTTNI